MIENREDFNLLQNVGGNRVKICTKKSLQLHGRL